MKKNKLYLHYLLSSYCKFNILNKIIVNNIVLDSRKVKKGDIFVAIIGNKLDGRNFIEQAILNGAVAILAESNINKSYMIMKKNVYVIYLTKLSEKLSSISGRLYQNPSEKLKVIAVTGTNGKTTITHLLSQWSNFLGEKSAVIGTIGNGLNNNLIHTNNTTDSAIDIQKFLHSFFLQKVNLVAIEVSSHGVMQNRVKSISFQAAIFTNLTHDHLDYHENMLNYELSKKMLFLKHKVNNIIINADDKIGYKWLHEIPNAVAVSIKNNTNIEKHKLWLKAYNIIYNKNITKIQFKSSWGNAVISTKLLGEFNVTNILLALSTLLSMSYSLKELVDTSHLLKPICGRMELFKYSKKPNVIVDYAHSPESLKKSLKSVRLYCKNNIWCIFGCGGNRDVFKRPIMGSIAKKYSDIIILTSDNPRNEKSDDIIYDITLGILDFNNVYIIPKRKQAINYAIKHADLKDFIFISGKGHEIYQIIGNRMVKMSDREIVHNLLKQ